MTTYPPPKHLYIIGNGFDRYHELHTSYIDFAKFLREKYPDIYRHLTTYFALPDLDPDLYKNGRVPDWLWNEFEAKLATLDFDEMIDDHIHLAANFDDPGYRDRDGNVFSIEMNSIVKQLTEELAEAFRDFILSITFPGLA